MWRIVLPAIFALGAMGCVSGPPLITSLPPLPPEEQPAATTEQPSAPAREAPAASTARFVLVISDAPPNARFQRPALVTTGEFVMEGAVTGAVVPVLVGLGVAQVSPNVVGLMILGGGLAAAPAGAVIGAGIGALSALSAPSLTQVEVSTATLERAVSELRVSDALRTQLLEALTDSPTTPAATVLEIGSPEIVLAAKSPREWIPELSLKVAVYVRLVRLSDGEELRRGWWWTHESDTARLIEWSKNDARLFREELERALRAVALQGLSDLGVTPVRTPSGGRRDPANAEPPTHQPLIRYEGR
jgi:hypothetical protein